jgi:hypothetical protein
MSDFNGMTIYKLYRDRDGNFFPNPRYVVFRHEKLVGEYRDETQAVKGFLAGGVAYPECVRADYKGLSKEVT